jgi:hypothetical protein
MNLLTPRACRRIMLCLLALGLLSGTVHPAHADQPLAHTIHLPLLAGGGKPGDPPPTPTTPTPTPPTPEPTRPVVQVAHDPGRAASAAIGPEGGELQATAADGTRFELAVPPGALEFTELITMTPALRAEGLPLSGGLLGAVSLEPAGLELYQRATVRIIPPAPAADLLTVGFAYSGSGERFHLRPLTPPAGASAQQVVEPAITMEIISIRPVGAGRGTQADVDRQLAGPPPDDLGELLDELNAQLSADISRLDDYYGRHLLPELYGAIGGPASLDRALRLFDGWVYFVKAYGLSEAFADEIAMGERLLAEALRQEAGASAERCYSQKRPEEGFRLLRWMRYAQKLVSSAEADAIAAKLRGCLTFELIFHSQITEGGFGDPYGYRYVLEAKLTLRPGLGTRATGSGPLTWQEAAWIGDDQSCTIAIAGLDSTFDAQQAPFGLSITPVSRTSPAVKFTLQYSPGAPSEQTSILCPQTPPVTASTAAWKQYFDTMHAYEREGGGYRTTAQVVGAGSFTGWVYHHTTSGPSGQAVVEETRIDIAHAPQP